MSESKDNLAKLETKTDTVLSQVVASRFTWAIVGAVAMALVLIGAKLF